MAERNVKQISILAAMKRKNRGEDLGKKNRFKAMNLLTMISFVNRHQRKQKTIP